MLPRYANIIANSSVILKKFKLKLTKDFWLSKRKNLQLLTLQRKHSTIEITDVVGSHSVLIDIFKRFGPHLRTLAISNSTVDDFTFREILKNSPVLEDLCLSEVTIDRKLPAINPTSVVHLKSVTVQHTNWIIFKFLAKSQIISLKINGYLNEGEGARNHLVSLLLNQFRLKELMLYGTSSRTLFKDNDINEIFNLNLTTFHIGCGFGKNSDVVNSNIINFLIANNETLRNVEISIPNGEHIIAFTLLNLNNVTSLTLDVRGLPKDKTFYETLIATEPNVQLKYLKLSGFFFHLNFVKFILMKYPSVSNLELDNWSDTTCESDMLKFVAGQFPQLQQLFIPEISNSDIVAFPALKYLNVSYIRNTQNLINFIKLNNSVVALKVGLVYIEQISSISKLMELTQVRHLSFAGSAKTLRMIVDLIQKNTPKALKTLELYFLSYEDFSSFTCTSRKSIKLNFPIDTYDFRTKLGYLI